MITASLGAMPIEIGQQLRRPRQWDEVIAAQVTGLGLQANAMLRGLGDGSRKDAFCLSTTTRTLLDFDLMFGYFDPYWGNVEHLALFTPHCCNPSQVSLTFGTSRDRMVFNLIGFGHHLQGVTLVAWLTTQTTLAWLAQTASTSLLQPIATRWLAIDMAVFGQLVAQHLYQHALRNQLLLQCQHQLDQTGFVGMVQKRLKHLYNFGASMADNFTRSLRKPTVGAPKTCKAEFVENEPCRDLERSKASGKVGATVSVMSVAEPVA